MIVGLSPYLMLDGDAREAVKFYEKALDAKVVAVKTYGEIPESPEFSIPDNVKERIINAHLKVGNTDLMISDTFPGPHSQPQQIGSLIDIAVTIDNVEKSKEVYGKLQEGGQVVMPLQKTFFSPSYGQVTDKFGVTWQVSTHVAE